MKSEPEIEVFASGAFDGSVGKTVRVKSPVGEIIGSGMVVSSDETGVTVEMTLTGHGADLLAEARSRTNRPATKGTHMTAEHCAAAPRRRWQIGRYRLEYDPPRWGLNDGCKGVTGHRTPFGAWLALRRWQRVETGPVEETPGKHEFPAAL